MILIGLGANLPSPRFGSPRATCEAALIGLEAVGVRIVARSRWYLSAPVPSSDQPWFVNAVVTVETGLGPVPLIGEMLALERRFGRRRSKPGEARILDLDLLDYHGDVLSRAGGSGGPALELPHPRLHERAFVLVPLIEVAPQWRHPVLELDVGDLIARLDDDQAVEPMPDDEAGSRR